MKVQAIVNPVSGRSSSARLLTRVGTMLDRQGDHLSVCLTQGPGDATRLAAQVARDIDIVLAVGGDGTVREVAEGLLESHKPLAVLPGGTENLVARQLGMRANAQCVFEALTGGRIVESDVGRVNGRRFLVVSGVGFDAEVVDRLAAARGGHITHIDYFWPLWRTFFTHRFPRLRVVADDQVLFQGHAMAFVGIQPRYSVGLRILRQAQPDDGLLDVCVYPCRSRARLLGHAYRTLLARHIDRGGVLYQQCRTVEITSPERATVQADGDQAGELPARFALIPRAIRFLVHPTRASNG
ncbi:MAG: diacylglycerol kinase family lipid kinase [Planctomycetes bacterium]|nr:diacylglycerol kinase family lipid kinase [Planctomycetota bacterium]